MVATNFSAINMGAAGGGEQGLTQQSKTPGNPEPLFWWAMKPTSNLSVFFGPVSFQEILAQQSETPAKPDVLQTEALFWWLLKPISLVGGGGGGGWGWGWGHYFDRFWGSSKSETGVSL